MALCKPLIAADELRDVPLNHASDLDVSALIEHGDAIAA